MSEKVQARYVGEVEKWVPRIAAEVLADDPELVARIEAGEAENPAVLRTGSVIELPPAEVHERADFEFVNAADEKAYQDELDRQDQAEEPAGEEPAEAPEPEFPQPRPDLTALAEGTAEPDTIDTPEV